MNDATRGFLKKRFRDYYAENEITPPPGLPKREWGFIFYDETPGVAMRRHKAFNTGRELNEYMRSMAPAHVYHSAAYYTHPAAPTMLEKKWLGADLIFDLDADHLPGKFSSYGEMLENVKKEIIRLIDGFLIDDFGFKESDLEIVFSGGRGYHVHIRDDRLYSLKSPERREIVDYIIGTGLDLDRIFEKADVRVEGSKGQTIAGVWRVAGLRGWNARVAGYMVTMLEKIGAMPDKEAIEALKGYGLERKEAKRVLEKVARNPESLKKVKERGLLELSGNLGPFFEAVLNGAIEGFKVDVAGKTDEPVTSDIKRLIRQPGSIHGGSSFKVMTLTRQKLETFNPLEDAIIFSDAPVRVLVTKPGEVEMKGKMYRVSEGVGRLPECVAMYLMCRGSAEYEP